jgi:5-methylcytosine-specific restriction endonuclease McrBC regulatory subunit McrC
MVSIEGHYIVHYLGQKKLKNQWQLVAYPKKFKISSKKIYLIMERLHGKDV